MEMTIEPKVVIVLAKCCQSLELFGIRFEERYLEGSRSLFSFQKNNGMMWVGDWAFSISEDSARREGYAKSEIKGLFAFSFDYPGCPHCKGRSIARCSCGKVGCWDGVKEIFKCPWCGFAGKPAGQIESLNAGGDR